MARGKEVVEIERFFAVNYMTIHTFMVRQEE